MARQFRQRLNQKGIVVMPGAFNALSARLIEQAGFEAVYITGAGLINGLTGYPDIGLLGVQEVADLAGHIANAVGVPCICDADTGFGETFNVMRTVQLFEQRGLAGLHIEDQVAPKRCGHLDGKQIISIAAMQQKVAAACSARTNPDFVVIARVDAAAVEGFDAAVTRAKAYVAAGADAIFIEALTQREEFARFAEQLHDVPLLANMTVFGKTPMLSEAEFEAMGYKMVIFPMSCFRVMAGALAEFLGDLKATGSQANWLERMQTRQSLYELLAYSAYNDQDKALSELIKECVDGSHQGV
ncbi:MAG: methylisocitrate lyase [Cyanobacteria bacterium HKST-UBA04]|nr:methylisocitrate lyase [Cyanobacteria bacterium HKST-UBA04]